MNTMSNSNNTSDTALLITFGILTLLAAIAGIHYRDSLCCLFCRSLSRAWHHGKFVHFDTFLKYAHVDETCEEIRSDLEGTGGLNSHSSLRGDQSIELQPRLSLPLYLDSASDD